MSRTIAILASLAVLLGLTSCAFHQAWREPADDYDLPPIELADFQNDARVQKAREKAVWETYTNFDLAVIEYKDNGTLWSPAAASATLDRIERIAMVQGATIVVFIHGWHHNARVCDGNLESFRAVLSRLGRDENGLGLYCPSNQQPVRVNRLVGVYIGWRGETIAHPRLSWASFWDRKRAAHRIGGGQREIDLVQALWGAGHQDGATGVIKELDEIYRASNEARRPDDHRSFTSMVTVGHSFGGALLFSAMENHLREEILRVRNTLRKNDGIIRGIGDLVVLVNPAFEARRYHDFHRALEAVRLGMKGSDGKPLTFREGQQPVMMVVSTQADTANKVLFPIGRFFSTAVWPRNWFDPLLSMTAIGFSRSMTTHTLMVRPEEYGCECHQSLSELKIDLFPEGLSPSESDLGRIDLTRSRNFGDLRLEMTRPDLPDNAPFMLVRTERRVLGGHSDIFTPRFIEFVSMFTNAAQRKNVLSRCQQKAQEQRRASAAH